MNKLMMAEIERILGDESDVLKQRLWDVADLVGGDPMDYYLELRTEDPNEEDDLEAEADEAEANEAEAAEAADAYVREME